MSRLMMMSHDEGPPLSAVDPNQIGLHESLHEIWRGLESPVQIATALVSICQAGADQKLRRDQAKTWWSNFLPDRVLLCARISSSLSEFAAALAGRLQGEIGGKNFQGGETHRFMATVLFALDEDVQQDTLDVLERQPQVCVTIVRASLDAWRKEQPSGRQPSKQVKDNGEKESSEEEQSEQPGLFGDE